MTREADVSSLPSPQYMGKGGKIESHMPATSYETVSEHTELDTPADPELIPALCDIRRFQSPATSTSSGSTTSLTTSRSK